MKETCIYPECVKLYVPDEPAGMLDDVKAWLLDREVTGFTSYPATGSWHDGQAWVTEPVTVIECWLKTSDMLDMGVFLGILADHGQDAGFYVSNGQGYLVEVK